MSRRDTQSSRQHVHERWGVRPSGYGAVCVTCISAGTDNGPGSHRDHACAEPGGGVHEDAAVVLQIGAQSIEVGTTSRFISTTQR